MMKKSSIIIYSFLMAMALALSVSCVTKGPGQVYPVTFKTLDVEVLEGTVTVEGEKRTNLNAYRESSEQVPLDDSPSMYDIVRIPAATLRTGEHFTYKYEYGSFVVLEIKRLGGAAKVSVTVPETGKTEYEIPESDVAGKYLYIKY